MLANFVLELNSKGLYQSSGEKKESCFLVFTSSTKLEIRHFHVLVVQPRQRNAQISVMHVQSCYFANLNLIAFLPSRSNDATATRTSLRKWICVLSVFIAIITTHLLCQLSANHPEAEFKETKFKLRKRIKISSLLIFVIHKTRN